MLEGARGTAIIWVVAAVLATLGAVRLLGDDGGGSAPPVKIDGGAAPAAQAGGPEPGSRGREGVFVHVAGAVRRPGLYRLDAEARVAEALQRAGGPLRRAELTAVNLAARVSDGQQVVVPVAGAAGVAAAPGAAGAAGAGAAGASGAAGGAGAPGVKLSLASATAEQLEELDGIGPTLAERIIEYRDAQGGLTNLNQLGEVDGIGEKRLASLREGLQP
jgi:competence protein ComEA